MDPHPSKKQRRAALVEEIISVVKYTKDRWFYTGIVDRIPELHIHTVLKKIQTEPEREIGHPGAYFFNEMVAFAQTLDIELPEPVNNDCAVPLCQDERSHSEPTPFLCLPHLAEFQHFKPETLYEEAGIVAYASAVSGPSLLAREGQSRSRASASGCSPLPHELTSRPGCHLYLQICR